MFHFNKLLFIMLLKNSVINSSKTLHFHLLENKDEIEQQIEKSKRRIEPQKQKITEKTPTSFLPSQKQRSTGQMSSSVILFCMIRCDIYELFKLKKKFLNDYNYENSSSRACIHGATYLLLFKFLI